MAWLDLALLSAIHVKISLTLLATMAFYGAMAMQNPGPQRRPAFARVRRVKRPSAE
jgi:hypothetical protein